MFVRLPTLGRWLRGDSEAIRVDSNFYTSAPGARGLRAVDRKSETDLSVAFAERWVGIFENLCYCFRLMPYGLPLRAVKKEKKLYLCCSGISGRRV